MKYGPDIVSSEIAEIFNEILESGKFPKEIKVGISVPIQKPDKKGRTATKRETDHSAIDAEENPGSLHVKVY